MASADERGKAASGESRDPVHEHSPDDISHISEGGELNPEHQHPPNAETQGVWKVLRYSTLAAIVAMVVIGVIAFAAFG